VRRQGIGSLLFAFVDNYELKGRKGGVEALNKSLRGVL
jgi:hypothetical protein